jgi:DNA polymerase V
MNETTKSPHGGKRSGAGRKTPASPYGEKTKVMRIPESKVTLVKDWLKSQAGAGDAARSVYRLEAKSHVSLNLYSHKVVAGFPSPADDNLEDSIDLNEHFVKKPDTSFLVKVQGDSMKNAGIHHGDMLVVDRSLNPTDQSIVIAALDGELTVKRLSIKSTGTWLVPENDDYNPIPVREESDLTIWGVVVSVLRSL